MTPEVHRHRVWTGHTWRWAWDATVRPPGGFPTWVGTYPTKAQAVAAAEQAAACSL